MGRCPQNYPHRWGNQTTGSPDLGEQSRHQGTGGGWSTCCRWCAHCPCPIPAPVGRVVGSHSAVKDFAAGGKSNLGRPEPASRMHTLHNTHKQNRERTRTHTHGSAEECGEGQPVYNLATRQTLQHSCAFVDTKRDDNAARKHANMHTFAQTSMHEHTYI